MALSLSAVKQLILMFIGGSMLIPIPTTTIAGSPSVGQITLGTLVSLAETASQIAGTVNSLSAIAENPVGGAIDSVKGTITELTKENFLGLDNKLSGVAANPNLSTSYNKFKKALGGGDGVSGITSELEKMKQHTDRLSGMQLSKDSSLSKPLTVPTAPGGRTSDASTV